MSDKKSGKNHRLWLIYEKMRGFFNLNAWYIFIENIIRLSSKFMLFLESLKQKQKAF